MTDPKIVRTKIDEGTVFVSSPGRSSGRADVDSFTTKLVSKVMQQLHEAALSSESPTLEKERVR